MKSIRLSRVLQFLLAYTILVILWGAWVRISHSGDGCGESWPLCKGAIMPEATHQKTWVEYGHRLMSGLFGILVLGILVWVHRVYPKGHVARRWAWWASFFTITEALLGAKLVLMGLVSGNESYLRTFTMSLHQINSLLLTGSVYLLGEASQKQIGETLTIKRKLGPALFLVIATTGAWASLASTLFPSDSLLSGLAKDFAAASHHTLRLRVFHPLFALLIGGSFIYFFANKGSRKLAGLFAVGVVFGILTLMLLSPVWMKITHLALAHILWIALLRWSAREQ